MVFPDDDDEELLEPVVVLVNLPAKPGTDEQFILERGLELQALLLSSLEYY